MKAVVLLLLLLAGPLSAQDEPRLRIAGAPPVAGRVVQGGACFGPEALEALGARVLTDGAGARAVFASDTIRLQATSPFLRTRAGLHQLAHPVHRVAGELCIPEQFFLQWLPREYPGVLAYREGALRLAASAAPEQAAERPAAVRPASERPAPAPERPKRPAQPRLVVIDPGHGGVDPGKVGPNGLREKDVVLQVSNRLAGILRERGYEVRLTRTRDTLIALADRPHLANRWKGERPVALFLSIHANAAGSGKAQGFETFFLSDARTEDERRVAEMENAAVEFEDRSAAQGSDFEQLLNTLRNDFYVRASNDLAAVVQQNIAAFHPGPNRGVKRAGFRVLVGAIMPAVLIELAFISDDEEARALGTSAFQQKLAFGIAGAVDSFFAQNEHLWSEAAAR